MTEKTKSPKAREEPGVAEKSKGRQPRKGQKPDVKKAHEAEVAELNDRILRLQADFDNFRKRTLREKSEIFKRANEELMEEVLPVLDHLDLALAHGDTDGDSPAFVEGVKRVSEQLLTALGRFGLSPIDASGKAFDPNLHEAVSHLPSEEFKQNDIVAQTRRGYRIGEKLLRAAQVVVSSGAAGESTRTGEEPESVDAGTPVAASEEA